MIDWICRAAAVVGVLTFAPAVLAEKDRYDVGEAVKNFTLKVVNAEEAGEPYVGIDHYYGPEAKEPKKAILLSFFATYCEPCKREMPYLATLYDIYRDKGLMVLSVTIDKEPEKIEEVRELAREHRVKFPILSDRFNIVAKRYFIEKLPCVYLIDGVGKVSMVNIGYNDDISKNLLDNIRTAIGESTSDPVPDALVRHMKGNAGDSSVDVLSDDAGKTEHAAAQPEKSDDEPQDAAATEETEDKAKKAKSKKKRKKKRRKKRRKRK
ncbi:redoxin domain-containing protein [Myxococcota bacterium]